MRRSIALLASLLLAGCGSTDDIGLVTPPPARPTPSPATGVPPSPSPAVAGSPAASSPATGPIRIALSGAAPDAIILDGTTRAWVLAGEGGSLIQVDLNAGRELRAIQVGFGPTHLAKPTDHTLAVARFSNTGGAGTYLQFVDDTSGAVTGIAGGELAAMAEGEGGVVWALEKSGQLAKVDATDRTVIAEKIVPVGQNVHIEVQWGAGSAWIGSDGLAVTRIDGDTLEARKTIDVPSGIPFHFDGLLWGAGPTDLWAIDPATNTISRHVPLTNVSEILALDIDGDDAWLAVRRPGQVGAVLRLDVGSGEVIEEFAVSLPAAVKLTAANAWVASYLTNELLGFERTGFPP